MTMFKTRSRRMYKEPGVIASFIRRRLYANPGVVVIFIRSFCYPLRHGREFTTGAMIDYFKDALDDVEDYGNRLDARFVSGLLGNAFGMIFARDK